MEMAYNRTNASSKDRLWEQIVKEYSAGDLTKPHEDKLIALAGVERQYSLLLDEKYIVGFYSSYLLWHLT
jgi:hypothetical protein